jgi:hypothetical protein
MFGSHTPEHVMRVTTARQWVGPPSRRCDAPCALDDAVVELAFAAEYLNLIPHSRGVQVLENRPPNPSSPQLALNRNSTKHLAKHNPRPQRVRNALGL